MLTKLFCIITFIIGVAGIVFGFAYGKGKAVFAGMVGIACCFILWPEKNQSK